MNWGYIEKYWSIEFVDEIIVVDSIARMDLPINLNNHPKGKSLSTMKFENYIGTNILLHKTSYVWFGSLILGMPMKWFTW